MQTLKQRSMSIKSKQTLQKMSSELTSSQFAMGRNISFKVMVPKEEAIDIDDIEFEDPDRKNILPFRVDRSQSMQRRSDTNKWFA